MTVTNFNCCLNPPPSNQNHGSSPSLPLKQNQSLAWNKYAHGSWTNRCVLGMSCIAIGLEMGTLVSNQNYEAIANAMPSPLEIETSSDQRVAKWSDKRMCPQWSPNSLETIAPENLPRPSAQRRCETVGFANKDAPAVQMVVRKGGNCFAK
ncbi:hypothetical protein D8674_034181 [Pyrus ussuriensis x Pyrus communis]|uniref:Uncharacterized protein n=1 Tax=Pyrus ussuriensis x Pyrus communis TaxID=2448454 RepID=A0A5N5HN77_9ROSA|nr:hypothetical protein D8674_034181 [Pyrus ussuriensis x Pyrus communis]